jgi:hypothetical protein
MIIREAVLTAVTVAAIGVLFGISTKANADVIPYGNPGTLNPDAYSFIAPYSGIVTAYFYASDAGYDSKLGLLVNGSDTGFQVLPNHTSIFGDAFTFGHVNGGAEAVFTLHISAANGGDVFFSNPSLNIDNLQHVYSTDFSGFGPIPQGLYIAFEDLKGGGDLDYNDYQFVIALARDVGQVPGIPETATWVMMLIGFAGLGLVAYRRTKKHSVAMTAA